MGKEIVHYYPYITWFKSSVCGIYIDDLGDHTELIKEVTCKRCIKKIKKGKNKLK